MRATAYFNINILHMYRNIYSKQDKNDCFGCLEAFFFLVHKEDRALRVNYKCDIKHFDFDAEDKVIM